MLSCNMSLLLGVRLDQSLLVGMLLLRVMFFCFFMGRNFILANFLLVFSLNVSLFASLLGLHLVVRLGLTAGVRGMMRPGMVLGECLWDLVVC